MNQCAKCGRDSGNEFLCPECNQLIFSESDVADCIQIDAPPIAEEPQVAATTKADTRNGAKAPIMK
ncbi:hypothetical protein GX645_01160 [Candidatus Sumerlaeota bacterium]|nr:hypothetical protein [Candidatus Sumerlaeales bacterium]NLD61047.1 hypothetical protein [Candidatus Sumerlaeota bacterium]